MYLVTISFTFNVTQAWPVNLSNKIYKGLTFPLFAVLIMFMYSTVQK